MVYILRNVCDVLRGTINGIFFFYNFCLGLMFLYTCRNVWIWEASWVCMCLYSIKCTVGSFYVSAALLIVMWAEESIIVVVRPCDTFLIIDSILLTCFEYVAVFVCLFDPVRLHMWIMTRVLFRIIQNVYSLERQLNTFVGRSA